MTLDLAQVPQLDPPEERVDVDDRLAVVERGHARLARPLRVALECVDRLVEQRGEPVVIRCAEQPAHERVVVRRCVAALDAVVAAARDVARERVDRRAQRRLDVALAVVELLGNALVLGEEAAQQQHEQLAEIFGVEPLVLQPAHRREHAQPAVRVAGDTIAVHRRALGRARRRGRDRLLELRELLARHRADAELLLKVVAHERARRVLRDALLLVSRVGEALLLEDVADLAERLLLRE